MTGAPLRDRVRVVDNAAAPGVRAFLEGPDGAGDPIGGILRHQQLLDALDRGDHRRLLMWPDADPVAVAHLSGAGTLTVAGAEEAGADMGAYLGGSGWRVMLGDAALANRILEATPKGLRRWRTRVREQRFMATSNPAPLPEPDGLRLATEADLHTVTELACRLHVEDRMGPPLARSARTGVAERMRSSIARGATWVVEREGLVVAKFDVSLRTVGYGAQIAGVFVEDRWRGAGIATAGVAAVARSLLDEGLAGVTLHVRSDNHAGRRAYERAGFTDGGAWTLALR